MLQGVYRCERLRHRDTLPQLCRLRIKQMQAHLIVCGARFSHRLSMATGSLRSTDDATSLQTNTALSK